MEIKIKTLKTGIGFTPIPKRMGKHCDWIDIYLPEEVTIKKGKMVYVPLNFSIELPKGYVACVYSRSSTPKNWNVIIPNSVGLIDNAYCGNDDIWHLPLYALKDTTIPKHIRIAQMEIRLSQYATRWQKIKHLFSSPPKFKVVDNLNNNNRKGLGSTGVA